MFRFITILVASAVVLAAPAFAQGFDFTPPINGIDIYFSNQNFNDAIDRVVDNSAPDNARSAQPIRQRQTNLSFTPSQNLRKQNMANFAEKMRSSGDTQGAAALEALTASTDIIAAIDAKMGEVGLSANNVADAYAVWWVSAWEAVNNRDVGTSRNLYQSAKRQAEKALLAAPEFASVSNAQKQEITEAMLIQAALIDASIDDAAGNATKQAALAKAVNQGAKHMGLDLTEMSLSEDGFARRSGDRSDVSDPAGDDSQLAANNGAHVDSANMGNYALYAIAGTGLLAGMFALGKGFSKKG